jgi:hypothetical protein
MRPVVANKHQRNLTLPEDKTVEADAEEVDPDTSRPANLNRFENLQRLKKSPANLNRFEKRSENLESKKTNHATSTATSSPPTTSPQYQQSSPKSDPDDAKFEQSHQHLNSSPLPKTNKRKNHICSKTKQ